MLSSSQTPPTIQAPLVQSTKPDQAVNGRADPHENKSTSGFNAMLKTEVANQSKRNQDQIQSNKLQNKLAIEANNAEAKLNNLELAHEKKIDRPQTEELAQANTDEENTVSETDKLLSFVAQLQQITPSASPPADAEATTQTTTNAITAAPTKDKILVPPELGAAAAQSGDNKNKDKNKDTTTENVADPTSQHNATHSGSAQAEPIQSTTEVVAKSSIQNTTSSQDTGTKPAPLELSKTDLNSKVKDPLGNTSTRPRMPSSSIEKLVDKPTLINTNLIDGKASAQTNTAVSLNTDKTAMETKSVVNGLVKIDSLANAKADVQTNKQFSSTVETQALTASQQLAGNGTTSAQTLVATTTISLPGASTTSLQSEAAMRRSSKDTTLAAAQTASTVQTSTPANTPTAFNVQSDISIGTQDEIVTSSLNAKGELTDAVVANAIPAPKTRETEVKSSFSPPLPNNQNRSAIPQPNDPKLPTITPQNTSASPESIEAATVKKSSSVDQAIDAHIVPQNNNKGLNNAQNVSASSDSIEPVTAKKSSSVDQSIDAQIDSSKATPTPKGAFESVLKTAEKSHSSENDKSNNHDNIAPSSAIQNNKPSIGINDINQVAAANTQLTPRVGAKAWDQALGQKVVWMAAGGEQTAQLTLNPPDLGPLQVVLSISNDQVDASFISSHLDVREAVQAAAPKLREMMENAGITLSGFSVDSQASSQSSFTQEQRASTEARNQSSPRLPNDAQEMSVPQTPRKNARPTGEVDTFA
ncbi:MAG: flagellar hook-length control protein FliK [Undibacterium sp.]|nr:flagellar hook-length control protein FliK [Undibacterium sp.]